MTANSITSTDTDSSTCLIQFQQTGDNVKMQLERNVPIDVTFTLASDSLRFFVYASNNAKNSAGDTFIATNFVLSKYITNPIIDSALNDIAELQVDVQALTAAYHDLPNNPYQTAWYKVSSGVTTQNFVEVISTTHAHCKTDAQLANLANEYEHVAISNYYPSTPWYPLAAHYSSVPEGFMGSPNGEQAHFSDTAAGVHINGVGSWLTHDTDEYDGTVIDGVRDIVSELQFQNAGGATINHPFWSGMTSSDIINLLDKSTGIFGMEIYNASCEWNNSAGKGYSLTLWDEVLGTGRQIFGLAVPDHWVEYQPTDTHGFGYNHLLVRSKTEQEILLAYSFGRFYSSIKNDSLKFTNIMYRTSTGMSVELSESCTIKFITAAGTVSTVTGTTATYTPTDDDIYVRVEATNGTNTLYSNAVII